MNKFLSKGLKWLILMLLLIGMMPQVAYADRDVNIEAGKLAQGRATTVEVAPLNVSVADCGAVEVYIDVNNVIGLESIDFQLSFDPNVVEVMSMTAVAGWFNAGFTMRNVVNNFEGTLWYAATQTLPTLPSDGSGHIVKLVLKAKSTAATTFTFTYIKLSTDSGIEIPATGVNGTVTASSSVTPDLDIVRKDAGTVQLSWPTHATAAVSSYQLWRSTKPYFTPTGSPYKTITNTGSGTLTSDDAVLGDVTNNYFYTMRAVCTGGTQASGSSRQVGKFEFQLFETTETDLNWIGRVLTLRPIATATSSASKLAAHIQANSNGTVSVLSISQWSATGQNLTLWSSALPFINNFAVDIKKPYQIEVNVDGSVGSVIWAQVGWLPSITYDNYTLVETSGTDLNWILQPLDVTAITTAISLANNINTQASAAVGVLSLSQWNGTSQNLNTYAAGLPFTSFPTRFGYPYQVEVNVNMGFSVTWP